MGQQYFKEVEIENRTYPENTIGFHFQHSKAIFGEESAATKYLQKKANECPKGFDERVVMHETQVVYLLGQLHLGLVKDDSEVKL